MLTSHRQRDLIQMAIHLDANGFLVKPVTEEVLKNHLLRMIYLYSATPSWLKPVEFYQNLIITESMNEIMSPDLPDEQIAIIQQESVPIDTTVVDENGNRKVAPGLIPERSVTAKDIMGKNGKVLYPAGSTLNTLDIYKLRNLAELDLPMDDIWICPEK